MRLFVAVNFDAETKGRLLAIQDKIKRQAVRGNFSKPENLHLTLVFIGETDTGLVPAITKIIETVPFPNAFSVTFFRTGCFRHSGKELWWIGAENGIRSGFGDAGDGLPALTELHRNIACGLETAGIPFDKRPFKAHITLGREIKPSAAIVLPETELTVPVARVSLMKSEHIAGVLTYTEIFGLAF